MINLIHADLYKLYKSSIIKILFGITILCAMIMTMMAYFIPKGQISSNLTGLGFMFSDVDIISILGAVVAGTFICGDFDNKTIHNAIASGCSRSTIIISKTVVFFCAIIFLLLPYAILTVITLSIGSELSMGSVSVGFLNLMTHSSSVTYTSSNILTLLLVILVLLLVYASQLSICIPLALVIKKPVLVVALYYGMTILCAQLSNLTGNSVFETIFSCTPFGGQYNLLTIDSAADDIVKAILVSLIFILIMLSITYTVFRKSEIK